MSEKALTNLSLLEPQPGPAGNAEVKAIYDSAETSKTVESPEDQLEQKTAEDLVKTTKKKKKKKKKGVHPRQNVKVNLSDCSYPVVSRVIKYLGWSKASNKENSSWDIYWKDNGSYSVSTVRQMCPRGSRRKLNHFGGMAEICLKHLLAHNMNRMKKQFPKHYNFLPKTWVLPHDKPQLKAYYQTKRVKPTFICKPSDSCQGRGIYLTRKMPEYTPPPPEALNRPVTASDSDSDDTSSKSNKNYVPLQVLVVQEYIPRPYLINGYKFDLRLYCLVTQVNPYFRCFLHKEGMARFCTTEYKAPSSKNIKCNFMHLTNFAINRKNNDFVQDVPGDEEVDDSYPKDWDPHEDHPLLHAKSGSKWTLTALFEHLKMEGHDVDALWTKFKSLVAKTILPIKQMLQHQYRASFSAREKGFGCYELLGFDVMLDAKLRPVLIEVNHLPSFETSAKIDDLIKSRVIADALMLAGIDENTLKKRIKKKKKVVTTPAEKKTDETEKPIQSSANKTKGRVEKNDFGSFSKGRDREKEKMLVLEIENERTLYENEYRGGFDRVVPLPIEVGGNAGEAVQPVRELYEKLEAAKSRLHKTTHAAEKRLEEIKRKRAERAEQEAKLNMIRQKHASRVTATAKSVDDHKRLSKDGKIFQVSSRLYPGPSNNNAHRLQRQNSVNNPNVPYVSSKGMVPGKSVLRTSTITLLAPRELGSNFTGGSMYQYSEHNGFVRSSAQHALPKRRRSKSNRVETNQGGFSSRSSHRFGSGGNHSNQRAIFNSQQHGAYANSGVGTGGNVTVEPDGIASNNYDHMTNGNRAARRGSFASIYGEGGLASMVRDNYGGPETRPTYYKPQAKSANLNRAWLNNGILDQPQLYEPKLMKMNFWESFDYSNPSRS